MRKKEEYREAKKKKNNNNKPRGKKKKNWTARIWLETRRSARSFSFHKLLSSSQISRFYIVGGREGEGPHSGHMILFIYFSLSRRQWRVCPVASLPIPHLQVSPCLSHYPNLIFQKIYPDFGYIPEGVNDQNF